MSALPSMIAAYNSGRNGGPDLPKWLKVVIVVWFGSMVAIVIYGLFP